MTTDSAASIVSGIALVITAGVLNGSWNASFSPRLGLAVGRKSSVEVISIGRRRTALLLRRWSAGAASSFRKSTTTTTSTPSTTARPNSSSNGVVVDLDYHYAWILFQLYAALLSIPICLTWAGGRERSAWIIQQTAGTDLTMVIVFSLLWGVGSVGFGMACRISGVGLGTNLTMGVIMVCGTLLPLIMDRVLLTAKGGVVLAGLFICCIGLFYSMKSLGTRDLDEEKLKKAATTADRIRENMMDREAEDDDENNDTPPEDEEDEDADCEEGKQVALPPTTNDSPPTNDVDNTDPSKTTSTLKKVLVCVIAGLFASQLQFAFVFGQDMIDLAESENGPGSTTSSGSAAIVWLFAFTISAPVSILYGLWSSPPGIPISTVWRCPWYRHVLLLCSTTLPWISHIHLYGIANQILPEDLAASVSWPVLMMMTVATGMLWSLILGEWKNASSVAKSQLYWGLGTITTGMVVIMVSLAVP